MKKILTATAAAIATMISFSAQAQEDEWHIENSALVGVCAADSEKAQAACKSTMIGFKMGFIHAAAKGTYYKILEKSNDKKAALEVSEKVHTDLALIMQKIDSDDIILEYAKVLKQSKHYRSLPSDYALGQALANLMTEAK